MSNWDQEDIETLKRMWKEGRSATNIALALKKVSRSAVLGKVTRLGLTRKLNPTFIPHSSVKKKISSSVNRSHVKNSTTKETWKALYKDVDLHLETKFFSLGSESGEIPGQENKKELLEAINELKNPPTPIKRFYPELEETHDPQERVTLMKLKPSGCKWCQQEDEADEVLTYFYCGKEAVRGSFCAEHGAIAYRTAQDIANARRRNHHAERRRFAK